MTENFEKVKFVLDKYKINNYWRFSPKYYDAYIEKTCIDYLYENSEAFNNSKYAATRSFGKHTFFLLMGVLVSIFKNTLRYNLHHANTDVKIIAMPFCGRYVWFKRLPQLLEEPIRVVYHPIFHYDFYNINKKSYVVSDNMEPEFYGFGWFDLLRSLFYLLISYRKLSKCSSELDKIFDVHTGKFSRIFIFPLIYGGFMNRFIDSIKDKRKKIWLFDYDNDYKYIIFNDVIHKKRKTDVTIHIQHGSFWGFNPWYCNPVCDYSLCCSNREKRMIERFNCFHSKICVLGAPLQTFDDNILLSKVDSKYDIVCLLTDVYGKQGELQKKTLERLKNSDYKIRIRYRPASKKVDKEYLRTCVEGMEESNGVSLTEDVMMAKMIVCFSEDAMYTAIKQNKPIVYIRDNEIIRNFDLSSQSLFFIMSDGNNLDELNLDYMITKRHECDYSNDICIHNNFGLFKLEDIQERLNSIVSKVYRNL